MKLINKRFLLDTIISTYKFNNFGFIDPTLRSILTNDDLTIQQAESLVPYLMEVPKCGECHQKFDQVVELGNAWDEKHYYCASCLKKALNLLWFE